MQQTRKNNNYIIKDNIVEMEICSPKYGNFVCILDIDDLDIINKYKFHIYKNSTNAKFYARCYKETINGKEKSDSMHRLIMNTPSGLQTDHINRDTLDNRRCNLRICTIAENKQNQDTQKNNKSSGYKNVYWCKEQNKWRVALRLNQKLISFGRYEELEDAIKVAEDARKKMFKFS